MTAARKESVGFGDYGKAFARLTQQEWRELFRAYLAGTSFMDAQLGRSMPLDKHQLWDKTIVIFVGDHGYHTGERQWWNKNTFFERSCRSARQRRAWHERRSDDDVARRVRRPVSHRRGFLRPENAPRRRRCELTARFERS
jgi:hypothetical protein